MPTAGLSSTTHLWYYLFMPKIISIGECFFELFSLDQLHADACFTKGFSGDTLNVLAMASRLGTSTGYITRVSDDPIGDYLLEGWSRLGIDTSQVKQTRGFNAFEFTSSEPLVEGTYVLYRLGSVASTMTVDDLDPTYIVSTKILCVSAISQGISSSCRAATSSASS